jgi:hypothetical protein
VSNSPEHELAVAPSLLLSEAAWNVQGSAGMVSLERFAQNRPVIEEFAAQWLYCYSTDLARLIDIARLRDIYTGIYHHPPLEEKFPQSAVDRALRYCHEEIFVRFIENTFEHQESDLRSSIARMDSPAFEIAHRWLDIEAFRSFVPSAAPPYLRDLFLSNVRTLLTMIVEEREHIPVSA